VTPQPPRIRMLRVGTAFVAEDASVTGEVALGTETNLWYGVVVRGDDAPITIGARTNVQDRTVIHVDPAKPYKIGADVTIGHAAICHGVRIDDYALIGMGAILLGGSVVGEGALVAAGTVVSEGMQVPPYSLVVGVPARVVRTFDRDTTEREAIARAAGYVERAAEHANGVWSGRVKAGP
jgi:carbonic anhydrase/acetyltransferase-like protein (isoleucine patch superfamily)